MYYYSSWYFEVPEGTCTLKHFEVPVPEGIRKLNLVLFIIIIKNIYVNLVITIIFSSHTKFR